MSTLLKGARRVTSDSIPSFYHRTDVLKSRENVFKTKCDKTLKKKLKKYKLRKDGQEDQDILDVSKTLVSSLQIKSPNSQHMSQNQHSDLENRPNNYLFKMVRLRKAVNTVETSLPNASDTNEDTVISLTPKYNQDHDKKQMDAFKLLMDSRNKSIGTNSPGKEKTENDTQFQEKIVKKELKAKRILSLQKMAQARGSLKNEKVEEYREECIKRKMEERAKRLKGMIVGVELDKEKKNNHNFANDEKIQNLSPCIEKKTEYKKSANNKVPSLTTIDLFEEDSQNSSITPITKNVSEEDKEFLQKLAPSMRKKENMLCYFQKVSKDSDNMQSNSDNDDQLDNDQFIIKVKLKTKNKTKQKKSRHVLTENRDSPGTDENDTNLNSSTPNKNSHKRKRNINIKINEEEVIQAVNISEECNGGTRPKRNTKRPVKYADEVHLMSSDEELHIFTPKKKRREKIDNEGNVKPLKSEHIQEEQSKISGRAGVTSQTKKKESKQKFKKVEEDALTDSSKSKANSKPVSMQKKATKLAPIFVAKQQLDAAALEAKHKFLHSGVPSKLKKNCSQRRTLTSDHFQVVVHVQQNSSNKLIDAAANIGLSYLYKANEDELDLTIYKNLFKQLLSLQKQSDVAATAAPLFKQNINCTLQHIKKSYPKFPVYRTYHLLKGKSKGEFKDCVYPELDNSVEIFNSMVDVSNVTPDKLNWTDKYRPTSEKQIIGNFDSVKELRKWLVTWTENNSKYKNNKGDESDSCDFYQSDADSRESAKNANNLLIITGKVGTGKTMSVYAVAAELSIKVLEVNASSKRTGKIMLQDLQEATQSHKVNRGKNPIESSQNIPDKGNSMDIKFKVMKKRGRKKKCDISENKDVTVKKECNEPIVSQDNNRTGMSLILIDDADVVFDQDDGFCSAISQLIQTSKRPVILVTSSLTCSHLQKFVHLAKIIKMQPFLPRMLGTWLDIMCLADNDFCCPGLGAQTLDYFKGDIRKAINYLQFYLTSHNCLNKVDGSGSLHSEDVVSKVNTDDESSCMSWADNVGWGEKSEQGVNPIINPQGVMLNYFMEQQIQLQHSCSSVNNLVTWWSLPNLLNYNIDNDKFVPKKPSEEHNSETLKELNAIAAAIDFISTTDCFNNRQVNTGDTDVTSRPWHTSENPSVIDTESSANYDRNIEVMEAISYELMTKSIAVSQRILECENKTDIQFPSMSIQRERNRIVSRHKTLSSFLSPSTALDRRALALDYWPSCRSICRTEKAKTDSNNKRNNRFCHYLKSLNVLCKNDFFDNLGESLRPKNS